jgi:hypothetical protein
MSEKEKIDEIIKQRKKAAMANGYHSFLLDVSFLRCAPSYLSAQNSR